MGRRLKLVGALLALLSLAGGVVYALSWLNARRYYLVVEPGRVRVGQGSFSPTGFEPFIPEDSGVRPAYRSFQLPGGIDLASGTTVFTDRVELDQALYRMLLDAARFALGNETTRAPELIEGYLEQLSALPGVNLKQQAELQDLEREANLMRGRQWVRTALEHLSRAEGVFAADASHEASRNWLERIRGARAALETAAPELVDPERPHRPTSTATTATSTTTE